MICFSVELATIYFPPFPTFYGLVLCKDSDIDTALICIAHNKNPIWKVFLKGASENRCQETDLSKMGSKHYWHTHSVC